VLAVVGLVVVPQLLSYVLSGLSGSASRPVFVSQITNVAVWSLVKFLAALSGTNAAYFGWNGLHVSLFSGNGIGDDMHRLQAQFPGDFSFIFVPLMWAFLLVWMKDVLFKGSADGWYQQKMFSKFRRVHEFFTRHSRQQLDPK
jgi:hypothetical protein